MHDAALRFLEFFAGGGLARLGLQRAGWRCAFANDIDADKCAAYRANFGDDGLHQGDVWDCDPTDIAAATQGAPADVAWASFPCQDLSLAGPRAGLEGARSSAFHGFWRAMLALKRRDAAPRLIVLENVTGLLSSHGGADFAAIITALAEAGYVSGALVADAADFVPQSRPRVFIIAAQRALLARFGAVGLMGLSPAPQSWGMSASLIQSYKTLPDMARRAWTWWRVPPPAARNMALIDVLEDDAPVWPDARTQALMALMAPRHRDKVLTAQRAGARLAGAVYRRVRMENGQRVQRAEARFDGLAGCLRTPAGGSSRQFILLCEDARVQARALTPRESARLMGVEDSYVLPDSTLKALKICGDGVAVPVVTHLARHLLTPLASGATQRRLLDAVG